VPVGVSHGLLIRYSTFDSCSSDKPDSFCKCLAPVAAPLTPL
jgi:hypothetical protein